MSSLFGEETEMEVEVVVALLSVSAVARCVLLLLEGLLLRKKLHPDPVE